MTDDQPSTDDHPPNDEQSCDGDTDDDSPTPLDTQQRQTDEQPRTATELDSTRAQMIEYAQWVAFALLVLVAIVATARFYFSASAAIETFVARRYRPLFMAGFNLGVVLCCGIGLSVLLDRLT